MNALRDLRVLILDGQTTGSSPAQGRLLELAWVATRASDATVATPTSRLLALPRGRRVPWRIAKLTGIDEEAMSGARPPAEVWRELLDECDRLASGDGARGSTAPPTPPVPTVVHFAQFEKPFLEAMHARHGRGDPWPFDLICTHRLALALVPDLPRRGLRALAGYFGHVLGPLKRAAPHVAATAVLWRELVNLLDVERGVTSLEGLRRLLEEEGRPRGSQRRRPSFPMSRERRLALPDAPGVYRMLARGGAVLYVGKATSLKTRFNSRYQKRRHDNTERTLELLTQVRDIDVTRTGSALEAALLENDEIKSARPPYNRALLPAHDVLWFATIDGRSTRAEPDADHVVGPLTTAEVSRSLAALGAHLASTRRRPRVSPGERRLILGLPAAASVPTAAVFVEGLDLFRSRLVTGELPRAQGSLAPLLRLGARLWRERLAEGANGDDADEADERTRRRERAWDADLVADALAAVVRERARLIRRAHLLVQLSEASLVFRPKGAADDARRRLVFERGRLAAADDATLDTGAPIPPGWARPLRERLAAFDVATYDRLRILSTELRRLLAEEAPFLLRLGPTATLGPSAAARRLRMV